MTPEERAEADGMAARLRALAQRIPFTSVSEWWVLRETYEDALRQAADALDHTAAALLAAAETNASLVRERDEATARLRKHCMDEPRCDSSDVVPDLVAERDAARARLAEVKRKRDEAFGLVFQYENALKAMERKRDVAVADLTSTILEHEEILANARKRTREAEAERDTARARLAEVEGERDKALLELHQRDVSITTLHAKVAALAEALKWYAEPDDDWTATLIADWGSRARDALKEAGVEP